MLSNTTDIFNKHLIQSLVKQDFPIGLANGKMGICIYLYITGRVESNEEYLSLADKLLDEITNHISGLPVDVENGLGGIGLGVNFLAKSNYIRLFGRCQDDLSLGSDSAGVSVTDCAP